MTMLVLMCAVGSDRLAIPAHGVIEVVPRVELRRHDDGHAWLAGHFVYRGRPIPVITLQASSANTGNRLSNRIIIVSLPVNSHGEAVGLLVDGATSQQLPYADAAAAERESNLRSRWGAVLLDTAGMFHLVDLKTILPAEMRSTLFPPAEELSR